MLQPWLIAFLIFAATFLIVQFAYGYFFEDVKRQRKTQQRFSTLREARPAEVQEAIIRRRLVPAGRHGSEWSFLERLLVQSGVETSKILLVAIWAIVGLGLAVAVPMHWPVTLPLGAVIGALAMLAVLSAKRARRARRFAEQLPDVLDVIVRSLKAGHPLPVSLSLVAREMPAPAGAEFALACDEITYGRDVREALDSLFWRVGYPDLQLFVTSVSVAYQTGGNLGDILMRLSKMLRERFRMRRKVKSLSSEGRFSAIALSLFPFFMFGIINLIAPSYYGQVWDNPLIPFSIGIAAFLLILGNFIMYRMVNFKI